MRSSIDVALLAYDVLEGALTASTFDEVRDAVRPDLEVLSREDLIRVAIAVAVEVAQMAPAGYQPRLLERVQRRRLRVMMAGS